MPDIKLFNISNNNLTELEGKSVTIEKSLQSLIEDNLETLLGVKFLATEYSTGIKHKGRIDTLGIDENNCPVIIEYKRSTNENVINQGLYYLDWLLDHKAEFQLLVMKTSGPKVAENIVWNGSRMICIAGDFTKYDTYAVEQINRNIELYRYKKFGQIFLLELINSVNVPIIHDKKSNKQKEKVAGKRYATVAELLSKSSKDVQDRYATLKDFILNLGDEVQEKELLYYFAFKRIKTFASTEIHPKTSSIMLYLRLPVEMAKKEIESGFIRDVSNIGHLGVGNLSITIKTGDDLEKAKPFIFKSYEVG
ncbi:MAG: DUF91 domain-containing protein [Ignavibacteriales bacterium]|nr:DUF91 domain-containing protein [Ignavibacteriales bacterium]